MLVGILGMIVYIYRLIFIIICLYVEIGYVVVMNKLLLVIVVVLMFFMGGIGCMLLISKLFVLWIYILLLDYLSYVIYFYLNGWNYIFW